MTIGEIPERSRFDIREDFVHGALIPDPEYRPMGGDDAYASMMYRHMEAAGSAQALVDFVELAKGFIDRDAPVDDQENEARALRVLAIFADMPRTIDPDAKLEAWSALLDADVIVGRAPFGAIDKAVRTAISNVEQGGNRFEGALRAALTLALVQKLAVISGALNSVDRPTVDIDSFSDSAAMDILGIARANELDIIPTLDAAFNLKQAIG